MDQTLEKPVLIVGFGVTGRSVLRYLFAVKKRVVIFDDLYEEDNPTQSAHFVSQIALCSKYAAHQFEMAIISPGIPPSHPILLWLKAGQCPITSELEIALEALQEIAERERKRIHLLAVTGTNGKTTTVEMTTFLLSSAGVTACAFGNIGVPLIEHITDELEGSLFELYDVYVLELSSYQIERMKKPLFTSCIWLNIAPDHLEWHGGFDAYKKAKEGIFQLLLPKSPAAVHISIENLTIPPSIEPVWYGIFDESSPRSKSNALYAQSGKVHFGLSSFDLPQKLRRKDVPLHDIENFLAAIFLLNSCGVSYKKAVLGYASFQKGAHRIQFFTEYATSFGSIAVVDDSKGTNIHATLAAVQSISALPIVLIAGGVHKGHPYTEWRDLFPGKVAAVIALGEAKMIIQTDLFNAIPTAIAESLEDAVDQAMSHAEKLTESFPSVTVLLSPGCASYDMFLGYADRGKKFQNQVLNYIENRKCQ